MPPAIGRWVPLLASTAFVVAVVLKVVGHATQADAILAVLNTLGLDAGFNAAEDVAALAIGFGLVRKYVSMFKARIPPAPAKR